MGKENYDSIARSACERIEKPDTPAFTVGEWIDGEYYDELSLFDFGYECAKVAAKMATEDKNYVYSAYEWRNKDSLSIYEGRVLVYNERDNIIEVAGYDQYYGRWLDIADNTVIFTHWQPLPAPPTNIAELGGVDGSN
ncbi:DUF551 domain-containing protein [Acetobacter cerevisiae]|uniref:DUF551 domain-containing protein n=1 Tax=Acetobacter cerevisiae TaxID=178900 RepID=A0A149QW22_9PROT|nr:hypothetical protein [Acetobacter cerevisiae]KXV01471.1 hypothetical protein AD928_01555 [Acetobacter cerevisiae]GBQ10479.1 hypothetical protein AA14362_2562 [Acetobacter cerevisiae DSM 14362]